MHEHGAEDIDSRLSFPYLLGSGISGRTKNKSNEAHEAFRGNQELDLYYRTGQSLIWGRCIILNYKSFSSKKILQRTWSKLDIDRLESTFKQLRFSVQIYEDLSFNKTIELLRKESKRHDNKDVDCFVICVLSHQAAQHYGRIEFQCADKGLGLELAIDQLTKPKSTMAGKPKIFLIEAGDYTQVSQAFDSSLRDDSAQESKCRQYLIPRYSDILIFYLTFSGYNLAHLEGNGSEYIRILCDTLRDHSHKCDLMMLLTMIARRVQNGNSESFSGRSTALVQIMSTLTQLVRLRLDKGAREIVAKFSNSKQ